MTYGYYHGYCHVDRQNQEPLFPFGFGLSYTTYRYANLRLTRRTISRDGRLEVTAEVTNTGAVPGEEIAQLYVGAEGSRVARAVKDLKGFARVHLQPAETRTVSFELAATDLAFYDTAAQAWEVEPITYVARVGPSSRELPLEARFRVIAGP